MEDQGRFQIHIIKGRTIRQKKGNQTHVQMFGRASKVSLHSSVVLDKNGWRVIPGIPRVGLRLLCTCIPCSKLYFLVIDAVLFWKEITVLWEQNKTKQNKERGHLSRGHVLHHVYLCSLLSQHTGHPVNLMHWYAVNRQIWIWCWMTAHLSDYEQFCKSHKRKWTYTCVCLGQILVVAHGHTWKAQTDLRTDLLRPWTWGIPSLHICEILTIMRYIVIPFICNLWRWLCSLYCKLCQNQIDYL